MVELGLSSCVIGIIADHTCEGQFLDIDRPECGCNNYMNEL